MQNTNFTKGDLLADKVNGDFNVLGTTVMNRLAVMYTALTLSQKTTVA